MNIPTVVISITALTFGIYTIYVRLTNPDKFGKLKAMQEKYSEKRGILIHTVFYSIIPIVFGLVILFTGFMGVSLF